MMVMRTAATTLEHVLEGRAGQGHKERRAKHAMGTQADASVRNEGAITATGHWYILSRGGSTALHYSCPQNAFPPPWKHRPQLRC